MAHIITAYDNSNLGNALQLANATQDLINNKLSAAAKSYYDIALAGTPGKLADVIAVLTTMVALGVYDA